MYEAKFLDALNGKPRDADHIKKIGCFSGWRVKYMWECRNKILIALQIKF